MQQKSFDKGRQNAGFSGLFASNYVGFKIFKNISFLLNLFSKLENISLMRFPLPNKYTFFLLKYNLCKTLNHHYLKNILFQYRCY